MTAERSQSRARQCAVAITIDEVDDRTRAVARMNWHDRAVVGVGQTRSAELLPDRAAERLSVSRALSDLVARLGDCGGDAPRE